MSSSRTNIRSSGKFSARAVSAFLPPWSFSPAPLSRSLLWSDRRPLFLHGDVQPASVGGHVGLFQSVEQQAVAAVLLLLEEARDADDGGRADPGHVMDFAIGELPRCRAGARPATARRGCGLRRGCKGRGEGGALRRLIAARRARRRGPRWGGRGGVVDMLLQRGRTIEQICQARRRGLFPYILF